MGCSRISRNTPATTMVLEWRRADTGVGPSIAAGSHGWRLNCADFPMAAAIRPAVGMRLIVLYWIRSSCIFIEEKVISQAVVRMSPISPIRL